MSTRNLKIKFSFTFMFRWIIVLLEILVELKDIFEEENQDKDIINNFVQHVPLLYLDL